MSALLEVRDLEASYGPTKVLHGISFDLKAGGITTILGANGSGKTTTLRALTGMTRTKGSVRFDGKELAGRPTEKIVGAGIAHVPEGRGTFVRLSVMENLQLGAMNRRDRKGIREDIDNLFTYFPILKKRSRQQAGTLSGGEQQMLAVARGLMLRPRLLLLDEPSFGLAPMIVQELFAIFRRINEEQNTAILIVEQNASLALDLADQAYLLETGRVVVSGESAIIKNDESVRRSYLGY